MCYYCKSSQENEIFGYVANVYNYQVETINLMSEIKRFEHN